MRKLTCLLVFIGLVGFSIGINARSSMGMHVIKLYYRDASEVTALIKPFLIPGAKVSGKGHTLIVKTSLRNLSQIRKLLKQIDVRPKLLRISIRQGGDLSETGQGVFHQHYQTRSLNQSVKVINVLEGKGAFISVGTERPYVQAVQGPFWPQVLVSYKKFRSGFWLVPYLQGQSVRLSIVYKDAHLNPESVVALQELSTEITIPLGQWAMIGGETSMDKSSSSTYHTRNSARFQSKVFIKVTKARNAF